MSVQIATIPLALYIHIPWCIKKCPYCDFNSHQLNNKSDNHHELFSTYVDALLLDIESQLPFIQNRLISSIFIGGGTPSLLPIAQYHRLFTALKNKLAFDDDIEITMEANPGTLEHAPFKDYLDVGINRLSIGVQSFDEQKLQKLGRIHNQQQAYRAIERAKKAGFKRLNVDIMHGLPEQTVEQGLTDIKMAHEAGATHLSWYQLTIEPNTIFYRNTPVLPDEDTLFHLEQAGNQLLNELGYHQYEVSAWVGKMDRPCRHNLNYWQFGDYLAIGAGAHGKVSLQSVLNHADGIYRYSKTRLPKDYMQIGKDVSQHSALLTQPTLLTPKMIDYQKIAEHELAFEFMLNVLRLTDGVDNEIFRQRTGLPLQQIMPTIRYLQNKGLLQPHPHKIATTKLGMRYLNQVIEAFL